MISALLSAAYILKERYNEPEAYVQRTLDIDPQHAQTHSNLAVICYYQKEYAKAWEHLQNTEAAGLEVHPDFKKELRQKLKEKHLSSSG